jgi:hypothetical protein
MRNLYLKKAVVLTLVTIFLTTAFSPAIPSLQNTSLPPGFTVTKSQDHNGANDRGWYWKPTYPNYAPSGVPDFDQQQDAWKAIEPGPNGVINSNPAGDDFLNVSENRVVPGQDCHLQTPVGGDDVAVWAFCGPVAVADCLWWYDSKYSDPTGTPGDGKDNFPLVTDYGVGDDHARENVPLLIEKLARAMKTNIKGTTYISDMNSSIHQWFVDTGLTNHFAVNTTNYVTFPYVEGQIEACQDVILLVGAYHQNSTKTVDQQQTNPQTNDNLQPINWWDYQSFIPSVNRLDAIQICLVSNGGPGSQCDVQVTVYNAQGATLGSCVLNPGFLPAATWIQFHFAPFIPLAAGSLYYFDVREVPFPDQYHYEWFYATGDPYQAGQGWMNGAQFTGDWTFKTEYYGGHRVAGHFLTCAGVNSDALQIAVSDPINDVSNPTQNHTSHNNAQNVSHDIYNVTIGSPYPNLPYHWYLLDYPDTGNATVVEQAIVICASNNNPNKPTTPSGQTLGAPNTVYTYTSSTTDPDTDQLYYLFDWGDGTNSSWVGPYASGATASANHAWVASGTYQVKVKAKDMMQAESGWSDSLSVTINTPPNKPAKPSGPTSGIPNTMYTYTSSTTDPEGNQVYYLFDWGDGTNSSWVGPYASGATASANHAWTASGTYLVKVKAKDTWQAQSDWSDSLSVAINSPPNKPAKPSGPTSGLPNTVYTYTTSAVDSDGDLVYFQWNWGDGNISGWLGPYGSGVTASATHSWTTKGSYTIIVKAKDSNGAESSWSDSLSVLINTPPNKPSKPSGTTSGNINTQYTYTSSTTDPDGDQVFYQWDWGDGSTSSWLGPFGSGVTASASHTWTTKNTFSVKVKAKDTSGAESAWSDPLSITMPFTPDRPFLHFLELLLERFPRLFPILRYLLGM